MQRVGRRGDEDNDGESVSAVLHHRVREYPSDVLVLGQDKSASMIVEGMTCVVGLLLTILWCSWRSWITYILIVYALVNANFAFLMNATSNSKRFRFFELSSPKRNWISFLLLGIYQVLNWELGKYLIYHRIVSLWWLEALEVCMVGAYVLYVVWRGRSKRFNASIIAFFVACSLLVVVGAAWYKHFTRKWQHIHIRHDWRLFYIGVAELVHVVALTLGTRFVPSWILEFIVLLMQLLLASCSDHERLIVD
eukprot:m.17220 g.17220  ORF g.17220 m.17220 type:complete len:251 (-) comp8120_c0_seq1:72-824(-)